ncbi:MAG TPA: AAA family ATPase [Acidimicrobiales bacterium]|nr:AAA family ATPase [Acidimicrobiales bacterium]
MRPLALLLAGPNGAGKSTSRQRLVPPGVVFPNADVEAARLMSEGHPAAGMDIAAGRAVLAALTALVSARRSFCLETNLAGRGLVRSVTSWQAAGFLVRLHFVGLRTPELALARVAERVAVGGHDVPEDVVRRRWQAGLSSLFQVYMALVDAWSIVDNSEEVLAHVGWGEPGHTEIVDPQLWSYFRQLAGLRP